MLGVNNEVSKPGSVDAGLLVTLEEDGVGLISEDGVTEVTSCMDEDSCTVCVELDASTAELTGISVVTGTDENNVVVLVSGIAVRVL